VAAGWRAGRGNKRAATVVVVEGGRMSIWNPTQERSADVVLARGGNMSISEIGLILKFKKLIIKSVLLLMEMLPSIKK
jgi:hypothetical protein